MVSVRRNITVLATTDDVAIGKSKSKKVGRRGLPGNLLSTLEIEDAVL